MVVMVVMLQVVVVVPFVDEPLYLLSLCCHCRRYRSFVVLTWQTPLTNHPNNTQFVRPPPAYEVMARHGRIWIHAAVHVWSREGKRGVGDERCGSGCTAPLPKQSVRMSREEVLLSNPVT